jgi:hypothetical protein
VVSTVARLVELLWLGVFDRVSVGAFAICVWSKTPETGAGRGVASSAIGSPAGCLRSASPEGIVGSKTLIDSLLELAAAIPCGGG